MMTSWKSLSVHNVNDSKLAAERLFLFSDMIKSIEKKKKISNNIIIDKKQWIVVLLSHSVDGTFLSIAQSMFAISIVSFIDIKLTNYSEL